MRIVVVLQSFFSDTFEFPIIYWDAESFWESFALFQDASNFPVMTFFPAFALADTCFHYTWLTGAFTGFLLTWEDTFWGRRPCLGSKRGRQPGRSPQTVQRSGSCSWNTQRKTFRLWDNETTDPKKRLKIAGNWNRRRDIKDGRCKTPATGRGQTCFCTHFIPCWKTEFLLVLQMIRSAHCTMTMLTKKAVWQVNSTIFLCS